MSGPSRCKEYLQGIHELKCGSAEVALGYLNKAIELDPEEELPLVVRSDCFTKYSTQ